MPEITVTIGNEVKFRYVGEAQMPVHIRRHRSKYSELLDAIRETAPINRDGTPKSAWKWALFEFDDDETARKAAHAVNHRAFPGDLDLTTRAYVNTDQPNQVYVCRATRRPQKPRATKADAD